VVEIMKVLITGGAGFIGANLAQHLVERNHDVVIYDDLSTGDMANLAGLSLTTYEANLNDSELIEQAVSESDAVVHLGARGSVPRSLADPLATHQANVNGTLSLLEALRKNPKHVIFSSSSSVYGDNTALPKHEDLWVSPVSPYGASKLASEAYLLAYQKSFQIPSLAFRFFNVYGPLQKADHDYAAVVPKFIWDALQGRPLKVNGDGTQTRDFTYVATVIDAVTQALEQKITSPRPVNLALGKQETLLRLIEIIEGATGLKVEIEFGSPRPGDVMHSNNDPTALNEILPKIKEVSLVDGVAATTDWLRDIEKASVTVGS
jgi:UDP-glucose 4-epimerase